MEIVKKVEMMDILDPTVTKFDLERGSQLLLPHRYIYYFYSQGRLIWGHKNNKTYHHMVKILLQTTTKFSLEIQLI